MNKILSENLSDSFIKIPKEFENLEKSYFQEDYEVPNGYSKIDEVSNISYSLEKIESFDKDFIEPKTFFGKFAFLNTKKIMFIEGKDSKDFGFVKIRSGKGLSLEPIFIYIPSKIGCCLFLYFDSSIAEMVFNLIRVRVGEKSKLKLYLLFENFERKRFVDFSVHLEKEGSIEVFPIFVNGDSSIYRSIHKIDCEKANFKESLITVLKKKEKGDFKTIVTEEGEGINVKVESRSVLKEYSRAFIGGLLKVKMEAKGSNSCYFGHCLKLSSTSKVDIQPNLEIEALDVVASHSASVSPIDEEKLFYLESRGLSKEKAEKEISIGFLSSLIEENGVVHDKIEEVL